MILRTQCLYPHDHMRLMKRTIRLLQFMVAFCVFYTVFDTSAARDNCIPGHATYVCVLFISPFVFLQDCEYMKIDFNALIEHFKINIIHLDRKMCGCVKVLLCVKKNCISKRSSVCLRRIQLRVGSIQKIIYYRFSTSRILI